MITVFGFVEESSERGDIPVGDLIIEIVSERLDFADKQRILAMTYLPLVNGTPVWSLDSNIEHEGIIEKYREL